MATTAEVRITVVPYNYSGMTLRSAHDIMAFRAPASGAIVQKAYWGTGAYMAKKNADRWCVQVRNATRNVTMHDAMIKFSGEVWSATAPKEITLDRNTTLAAGDMVMFRLTTSGAPTTIKAPFGIIEWVPRSS